MHGNVNDVDWVCWVFFMGVRCRIRINSLSIAWNGNFNSYRGRNRHNIFHQNSSHYLQYATPTSTMITANHKGKSSDYFKEVSLYRASKYSTNFLKLFICSEVNPSSMFLIEPSMLTRTVSANAICFKSSYFIL